MDKKTLKKMKKKDLIEKVLEQQELLEKQKNCFGSRPGLCGADGGRHRTL